MRDNIRHYGIISDMEKEEYMETNTYFEVKNLLGKTIAPVPRTFSSKTAIAEYLVTETEDELFGERNNTFRNFIFNECKTDDEILEILSRFITWTDTDGNKF